MDTMCFFRKIKTDRDDFDIYLRLMSQLTSQFQIYEHSDFIKLVDENTHPIYYYVVNEVVVGTFRVIFERKFYNKNCYVTHVEDLVVDENHRGKGYGKKMTEHAISLSKKKGSYKVILDCSEDKKVFYEKCGFRAENVGMCLRLINE
jgi:GNAT superfamily N-acetyltransferase